MAHKFPSDAWAAAYKEALNANPKYAVAGKDWTHGAVALVIKAQPEIGIDSAVAVLLDVDSGKCRDARYLPAEEARQTAPFVIEGTYARWQTLLQEGGDPIKALMQGKFKLTKGHLPTIIRYVESSRQLMASAQLVPTEFLS